MVVAAFVYTVAFVRETHKPGKDLFEDESAGEKNVVLWMLFSSFFGQFWGRDDNCCQFLGYDDNLPYEDRTFFRRRARLLGRFLTSTHRENMRKSGKESEGID